MTRTLFAVSLLFAAVSSACTLDPEAPADPLTGGAKSDQASATSPDDEECIQVASHLVETFVLRNWDFDRIESAEVVERDQESMTIDLVALDGGHDEGMFRVELIGNCFAVSIEELQWFTPTNEVPVPPPPVDVATCQEHADLAVEAFILAHWDFDFIQSHVIRKVTKTAIIMDLVAIDGGFDDAPFVVRLDRLCNVEKVVQAGTFTP